MSNRLPDHLRVRARKIARHEFGHYVTARLMGFRVGQVSIELTGEFEGQRGETAINLTNNLHSLDDARSYLERRVLVLYAGAISEVLPLNRSSNFDNEEAINIFNNPGLGAEQDRTKVVELIHALRNISYTTTDISDEAATQANLSELTDRLWKKATELVHEYASTIGGLADNLAGQVTGLKQRAVLTASYLDSLAGVKTLQAISYLPITSSLPTNSAQTLPLP